MCKLCAYGQVCPKCPDEGSVGWNPPLILSLYNRVMLSNQSTSVPLEGDGDNIQEITKEKAIALIKNRYPELKNIEETPEVTIGKSMDIRAKQEDDLWKILFWQGSGDCPAGCLNDHEWYFTVKNNGSVEKAGEFERNFNSRKNGYDEKGIRIPGF